MIIRPYKGIYPTLAPTVRIAENAAVIGRVTCGERVNIWYSAVIRGDEDEIRIGADTNIQDGAVVHCDGGIPTVIGERVTVGHGAIVHSCTVGDDALIGMGATVLTGAVIGKDCIIGAGALVKAGTVVPDGMLAVGVPAKVIRPVTDKQKEAHTKNWKEYVELSEQLEMCHSGSKKYSLH